MKALLLLLFALLAANTTLAFAPDPDTTQQDTLYRITLKDGSELIGRIESQDSTTVRFATASGVRSEIKRNLIESIDRLEGIIEEGQYRRADPNRTRLFFGPTARPLRSGQGYFSVYEIFFPFLAVGVADVFSLAGGMTLFPGADEQAFFFAPRIFIPLGLKNFDLAAGVFYGTVPGEEDAEGGIFYGVATIGSPFVALTAGLGYGFTGDEVAEDPVILLGFEAQLSNSVKFISENWIVLNSDVVPISFGIRFFGDRLAADFAFIYPLGAEDVEGWPFIPWIGFAYNFGR